MWFGSRSVTGCSVYDQLKGLDMFAWFEVDIRLGGARVTEMPKSLSTLKSESRVMSMVGCSVGTCALKLTFRRVILATKSTSLSTFTLQVRDKAALFLKGGFL